MVKEAPGPVCESRRQRAHREEDVLPEKCGIVVRLLEGQPSETPYGICLCPLDQQGRFAVAGGSLDDRDLAVANVTETLDEFVPSDKAYPSHRRVDLGDHQGWRVAPDLTCLPLRSAHCCEATEASGPSRDGAVDPGVGHRLVRRIHPGDPAQTAQIGGIMNG
jgi:hypothetical protein